jgi:hypothetical protein
MTPAVAVDYAVRLDCCADENPRDPKHIVLPYQSLLGIFEYPRRQLSDEWPATFLCLRHGRSFVCSEANFRLEAKTPVQDRPSVWRIQCVCAQEGCGVHRTIYSPREREWANVLKLIAMHDPKVDCNGHNLCLAGVHDERYGDCTRLSYALICALEESDLKAPPWQAGFTFARL